MAESGSGRAAGRRGPRDDRALLVAAVSKVAAERGYSRLTVDRVVRCAGVSRATFEEHFESREQGLIAAQDAFLERLWQDVSAACEAAGAAWPQKVRATLAAVLGALVEASDLARVFAIEGIAASLALAERQHEMLDRFAALLREGRRLYPAAASLPETMERALVGGIASIVTRQLLAEEPQAIDKLEPELVELVLIPYLGDEAARRVAVAT
ncbi:MAG TPA: TetR/AcrR family transcriptional regulator [Solirubrobacterales bacterium]